MQSTLLGARTGEPTPPLTRDPSQERRKAATSFAQSVRDDSTDLLRIRIDENTLLTGEDLCLSDVVAVARYRTQVKITDDPILRQRIDDSVSALAAMLQAGELVYGVNTGYGGSADTRTSDLISLQRALVQHQHVGVLTLYDTENDSRRPSQRGSSWGPTSMPTAWVRGMMLSRINSLLRGHSAVSITVIEAIQLLLNKGLTPVVPLRGSISASGDLQPLSYVAGLLQGNPCIYVRCEDGGEDCIINAQQALSFAGMTPIVLGPKEGLGLLNGTAASVAAASLVLHDVRNLALLSQALTAMAVEALSGTLASFDPFISIARPHRGQEQAAATIREFLTGSRLTADALGTDVHHKPSGLCQDRYALRTSPQWIGPLLEDLELATTQIEIELNSTTDNPLIDTAGAGTVVHGGNFQASSVTSAMEKSRNALQQLGKMLFAQSTEMNNPSMSRGLPPNLSPDDPSTSFTCKGIDITMAAYASELGWLNHPVGPHVQSAEMHNQAINSLALLSARATQQAVEVMHCMCAAYLFMVCQALDLRVLLIKFYSVFQRDFADCTGSVLHRYGLSEEEVGKTIGSLWQSFPDVWCSTSTMDLKDRCDSVAGTMNGKVVATLARSPTARRSMPATGLDLEEIMVYQQALSRHMCTAYKHVRSELFNDSVQITTPYLGRAASAIYMFVRSDLGVPFVRGLEDDPTSQPADVLPADTTPCRKRKTLGCWISIIHESLEDGRLAKTIAAIV